MFKAFRSRAPVPIWTGVRLQRLHHSATKTEGVQAKGGKPAEEAPLRSPSSEQSRWSGWSKHNSRKSDSKKERAALTPATNRC